MGRDQRRKVLIVEDDPAMRAFYVGLFKRLRNDGFTAVVVKDGERALDILHDRQADLVVLDWNLPGITGKILLRALRAHPKTRLLTVLMVTRKSSTAEHLQSLDFGTAGHLSEPFDEGVLRTRLRSLIRWSTSVALTLGLAFPFPGPAAARAIGAARASEESPESTRLCQAGMDYYSGGDLSAALTSFREALRREPNNRAAFTAVRRLESETAKRSAAARHPAAELARRPAPAGAFDRFFLVSLPRWFYFERTLGDGLRDVGTLTALNARVVQLMGEREIALAHNRPFRKGRQLRALLRRAPVATQRLEEV